MTRIKTDYKNIISYHILNYIKCIREEKEINNEYLKINKKENKEKIITNDNNKLIQEYSDKLENNKNNTNKEYTYYRKRKK